MFKDREKLYQAYHTLLSIALTWALVLVINQYFNLRIFFMVSAFYSFIPAILIYLFDINRKNIISYLLLAGIIPVLALIFWMTGTNPIRWVTDIVSWCSIYNGSEELYNRGNANLIIFLVAVIGAILFYLLTRKLAAKIVLAAMLLAAMIILSISGIEINKAVISICIFYMMTTIIELYGIIVSRKAGRKEKKEGILYLAPICFLLALFAITLPSKKEPIQWKAFTYIYNSVKEQIAVWQTDLNYYFGGGSGDFIVNFTGYSEDNKELDNSGLIKDTKVALRMSGLGEDKSVYLAGSVSNIYTGSSWEKTRKDMVPNNEDYFLDYVEMYYALSRQGRDALENNRFLERKAVRIVYNNIKTKTFFYPLKMSSYDIFSGYRKLETQLPQISFKKARGKGTSYQTIYYEMNLQGEAFTNMLRDADTFSYDTGQNLLDKEMGSFLQGGLLRDDGIQNLLMVDYKEELAERAEMINAQYTVLPDTLPDRVYELALEITAGSSTKYDKLKAIEEYLVSNYTYSLNPQKVPEGEDFVDYFLFESGTGYCTAYATAMAVLGRCIGVPTRYVEGYLAKFNKKGKDNMYEIKNSYAHAWTEVYFEGVGWIPFEATTPFFGNRYIKWKEMTKTNGQSGTGQVSPNMFPNNAEQPNLQPEAAIEEEQKDSTAEIITGVIIFVSIILILLLLIIAYYYVLKYRYKKDYEKADYSSKMYMLFLRILKQLRREGYALLDQETVQMLSDRVKDKFYYERVTFPDVADIFMRYRYADEAVTKEELAKVEVYLTGLANKERTEESRLKVWMEEFLFLTRLHAK